MERVKYYSKNDLGNGLQLLQTEKVLDRKVLVYYCHNSKVRAEIDVMVKEGVLKYDDYLLSPQERHYINFFLNASEYSNGMQLRNKYSHGAMSCLDSEEEHKSAYYYFLMIFVIILLKMNDDMNLALWLNEAIKRGKNWYEIRKNWSLYLVWQNRTRGKL